MDPVTKVRTTLQGLMLIGISPIGMLGFAAFATQGNYAMMAMFGIVTPLAIALGVWLLVRDWRS